MAEQRSATTSQPAWSFQRFSSTKDEGDDVISFKQIRAAADQPRRSWAETLLLEDTAGSEWLKTRISTM